jgi:outer membrane lipoprotein carrier protein
MTLGAGIWRSMMSLAAGLWVLGVAGAAPNTNTALDRYLDGLSSLNAQFTQAVTDAHGKMVESGSGTLLVQRPGKFRWDYLPHSAGDMPKNSDSQRGQLLVADGRNLWFYDRELAQVSVKPVEAALSATPVMLLSGSPAQLRDSFEISAAGSHDGMEWVRVVPRSAEADFSGAQLGFTHDQLTRMVVNDRLGQTVRLDFSHEERNGPIDAAELQFKPPAGVDVIGTPQS